MILYLTYWYTRQHRAKMVAAFMAANPVSGVLAGPISGAILAFASNVGGLRAWQWLFLLQGIPSILAGAVTLFYLDDNPSRAKWLTNDERGLLLERLQQEEDAKGSEGESRHRLIDAFKSGRVWLLCVVYFGFVMGNYGLWFWLPQIDQGHAHQGPLEDRTGFGDPLGHRGHRHDRLRPPFRCHR